MVSPDDAGDALFKVVDADRQLIGPQPVAPLEHEVPDPLVHVLREGPEDHVAKLHPIAGLGAQAERRPTALFGLGGLRGRFPG